MKKGRVRLRISLLLCTVFLIGMFATPMVSNAEGVKISNVEYVVNYKGAKNILLSNKKSIGNAVGTEVYLTYTVKSAQLAKIKTNAGKVLTPQQGVVATSQPAVEYPYLKGQMEFSEKYTLLQEGYTYFYKFAITEDGFDYTIIRAKGDKASYVVLPQTAGSKEETMDYFGVYLGQHSVTAQLTNVRCYDKDGNDLGIQLSNTTNASYLTDVTYKKNAKVDHAYRITVEDQYTFAISNKKQPTSDTVYMEYTVESSKTKLSQNGLILTQAPTIGYPYSQGNGYMLYDVVDKKSGGELLVEGAEYIIRMDKKSDGFTAVVQRVYKGEKSIFTFSQTAGEFSSKFNYFALWFGDGSAYKANFILKDFKCYDSNNVNLGVQSGRKITAVHSGQLEDYAGCEAIYYCHEDGSMIILYKDQKMKFTKGEEVVEGTYSVIDAEEKVVTLSYGGGKEIFSYLYTLFTNAEGKTYERLGIYKVSFVTYTDEEIKTQTLSLENGFKATQPETPKKEGNSFEGWITSDGKQFDFDAVTTESKILYAKWSGDVERKSVTVASSDLTDATPYISVAIGVVILLASIAGVIMLIQRGRKKGENEKRTI